MKTFLLMLALGARCLVASGQNYAIDWHSMDGGGGTSTGGTYTVSGTIGQPDAGAAMSGGSYSLVGGFWALPLVLQTPGAPLLSIVSIGAGQARISWTPHTPGFVLQENTDLNTTNWVSLQGVTTNSVILPVTPPLKAYRLQKP